MADVKYVPLKQEDADLESGLSKQQPHVLQQQQQQPVAMTPMASPPAYSVQPPVQVIINPVPPSSNLVPALLATFCCFLPFGIVALIYAVRAKVRSLFLLIFLLFFFSFFAARFQDFLRIWVEFFETIQFFL